MSMSNKEYHKIAAISHSFVCNIKTNGVYAAFIDSVFNPNAEEPDQTDALVQGQLYHTLIANPDIAESFYENGTANAEAIPICLNATAKNPVYESCYIIPVDDYTVIFVFDFGLTRSNLKYMRAVEILKQSGRWTDDSILVNTIELSTMSTMVHTLVNLPVYTSLMANEVVAREEPIFFEYDGVKYKAKPDLILKTKHDTYIIVDYKSTRLTSRESMQREGEKMGYDIQDSIYRRAVADKYGVSLKNIKMVFLMQNKDPKYNGLICYALGFEKPSQQWADANIQSIVRDFMWRYEQSEHGTSVAPFLDMTPEIYSFSHYEPKLDLGEATGY